MPRILIRIVLPAFAALVIPATGGFCQAVNPKIEAVNTVLDFRLNWVGDPTKFSACSVFDAVGRPADFPRGVLPPLLRGFDSTTPNCTARHPEASSASRPRVAVDSVTLQDNSATAYVTVHKGEQVYREDYYLINRTPGVRWGLREVRVWGATRVYPSHPPSQKQRGSARRDGTR